jgi:hypothetical protein
MFSARVTVLAGVASIVMAIPATASLSTSTQTRPVQPTAVQYAQNFFYGSGPVDYNYKSKKKSAKSKSSSGQAKSTDKGTKGAAKPTDTAK